MAAPSAFRRLGPFAFGIHENKSFANHWFCEPLMVYRTNI
jgi:hypothetical protein